MLYSVLGALTIILLYNSLYSLSLNFGFGFVSFVVGITSALLAFTALEVWLYWRAKRGLRGEERTVVADWTARMLRTRAKMERYLQDL
jgi:hypothetical protein